MTKKSSCLSKIASSLLWAANVKAAAAAYTLDLNSTASPILTCLTRLPVKKDSLKTIASSMTQDMMSFYTGTQPGGIPGLLPQPYYWWEAGALMGSLIDYWYYTGDTKWNHVASQGLLFQVGPNSDYMPPNQTMTEGNDDQGFWGMAVMTAAEYKFPNPPSDKPQWLALAQAVFNTQAARWDSQDCGGGLRWQIFTWNNGFDYKNSISQACFFNLAARLARYTGNSSYADWADKTWDWMVATNLLSSETYYVYDGIHTTNCSEITPYQWTYNAGAFLLGVAAMYNYTTGHVREVWRERLDGMLNGTLVFFTGPDKDIMTEVACEPVDLCDLDQQSFKAYLSRWMAATTKWAPWTYPRVKPLLESSAKAATSTCKGGNNGRLCGLKWNKPGEWDGTSGVGQQMAAMEVVLGNMIEGMPGPVTASKGGLSVGDPGAGGSDVGRKDPFEVYYFPPVSTGGKFGAAILTILIILGMVAGCTFVLLDEMSEKTARQRVSDLRSAVITAGGGGWASLKRLLRGFKERKFGVNRSDSDETLRGDGPGLGQEVFKESVLVQQGNEVVPIIREPVPKKKLGDLSTQQQQRREESYWNGMREGGQRRKRLSYPRVLEGTDMVMAKSQTSKENYWEGEEA
ncbi:family 76 putative glycoside hydrolase [Podospora fimiseda]|uniref:mannan endo-1,6-alpha-mannosidase n=1 Tax=Podospora fimiseda TaxID=252190 RepID=A0AAN7C029_9PEZI|nr:family 76 putative glycoside hydrolase [Podospora fimiseda]